MTTERELDEILAEMGREHRAIRAPESPDRVLFEAAEARRRAARQRRIRFTWAIAAAVLLLAALMAGGVVWNERGHQTPGEKALSAQGPVSKAETMPVSEGGAGQQAVRSNSAPVHRLGREHASPRRSAQERTNWNPLDEFVALPVSEGLPTAAELSVVRIRLRGSDLLQYGLQAPADDASQTLLAEFVVGEDGLPRAIRIVR